MNLLAFLLFIFLRHFPGNAEEKEKEIIEDYARKRLGKRIIPVLGDGHCMLYAFGLGLTEKDDYSYVPLLAKIEKEFLDNRQLYSDFVAINKEDLDAYIEDKKYNSNVVDLVPNVVANITNVRIEILEVRNGQVEPVSILPRDVEPDEVERTIYVSKIGEHYNAVLDAKEAASGVNIEGEPDIIIC